MGQRIVNVRPTIITRPYSSFSLDIRLIYPLCGLEIGVLSQVHHHDLWESVIFLFVDFPNFHTRRIFESSILLKWN